MKVRPNGHSRRNMLSQLARSTGSHLKSDNPGGALWRLGGITIHGYLAPSQAQKPKLYPHVTTSCTTYNRDARICQHAGTNEAAVKNIIPKSTKMPKLLLKAAQRRSRSVCSKAKSTSSPALPKWLTLSFHEAHAHSCKIDFTVLNLQRFAMTPTAAQLDATGMLSSNK